MRKAWRETGEALWRSILILATFFALVAIGALGWLIYPAYFSRQQNVSLYMGMTVEKLAQARPGAYVSTGSPRRLRPLRRAPAGKLAVFTGELRVRTVTGITVDLPFNDDRRGESTDERATDAAVEAAFPSDRTLDTIACTLPQSIVAHLMCPRRGEFNCVLPKDVPKLSPLHRRTLGVGIRGNVALLLACRVRPGARRGDPRMGRG